MSTGIPVLSAWQIELINANRHAPLEGSFESDEHEKCYQDVFEEILNKECWSKYDNKKDFQDGVVFDSVLSDDINQDVYSLVLSNSAEDAKKLNELIDIKWWQEARKQSSRMIEDGSCNAFMGWEHDEDNGDNDSGNDWFDRGWGYTGTRDPQRLYA